MGWLLFRIWLLPPWGSCGQTPAVRMLPWVTFSSNGGPRCLFAEWQMEQLIDTVWEVGIATPSAPRPPLQWLLSPRGLWNTGGGLGLWLEKTLLTRGSGPKQCPVLYKGGLGTSRIFIAPASGNTPGKSCCQTLLGFVWMIWVFSSSKTQQTFFSIICVQAMHWVGEKNKVMSCALGPYDVIRSF